MNVNVTPPSRPTKRSNKWNRVGVLAGIVIVALLIVLVIVPPFVSIPAGHTGVVTTFGRVSEQTLDEGLHLKNPISRVIIMDHRTQKKTMAMGSFSKDIQQVDVVSTINFRIDRTKAQTLYQTVGVDYYSTVMEPRIHESVKAVFTRYTAESLMTVRDTISEQVEELLKKEMEVYAIEILSVSIEDIDFTDAFTDAVEAKQVAEQTKLKVETEQKQQVSVERSAAERRIIAANADAEEREILAKADAAVAKIQAEAEAYAIEVQAEAEAEANIKIAASMTDLLIQYQQINRWDGKLPQFVADGSAALPILDLSSAQSNADSPTPATAE